MATCRDDPNRSLQGPSSTNRYTCQYPSIPPPFVFTNKSTQIVHQQTNPRGVEQAGRTLNALLAQRRTMTPGGALALPGGGWRLTVFPIWHDSASRMRFYLRRVAFLTTENTWKCVLNVRLLCRGTYERVRLPGKTNPSTCIMHMARPMCRSGRHTTLCRMRVLLVKAGLSVAWSFFQERHQNTRRSRVSGCPCRLRAPRRVGVRVRSGVGLVWAHVQG